jgi:hypothetical protein
MPIEAAEARHERGAARQHGAMEYTTPPTDLDAVRLYRARRLVRVMEFASDPLYAPSARTRPFTNRNTRGAEKTAIMVMSQK